MPILPQILLDDAWLMPFKDVIIRRLSKASSLEKQLCGSKHLRDFATGHLYYGLHKTPESWIFREWAPNATEMYLVGEFNNWKVESEYALKKLSNGNWEIQLPHNKLSHQQQYQLLVKWQGGEAHRLPSYGNRMVQDINTKSFNAQIWYPDSPYQWKHKVPELSKPPMVYEAHIGMSSDEEKVSSFCEFRDMVLPYIAKCGYNVIQLMAIQEHPYYGSFGYHISNFYAVSSRFGTPDDLKSLIDKAHGLGIRVIMDLVHSHSVKNEMEGLGMFDGTGFQYFHEHHRRMHMAWDSLCFNYGSPQVMHFLLSNCQYWLEEFHFDGFRYDGVTSMLYYDHGLERDFTEYKFYFDGGQDEDAIAYLMLSNKLIHEIRHDALTIAEEVSGMPGIATPYLDGGYGFDYRLAMGVPDYWIKMIKEKADEEWNVSQLYNELISHRKDEKTISYTESHDQALVGDKTIFFRLCDKEAYFSMEKSSQSPIIDRAIALHKMLRLITIATAGGGYLNFMGNEFGHPEWIDFPREGNGWSYKFARRQWQLAYNPMLKYGFMLEFDKAMIETIIDHNIFLESFPSLILAHEKDQVLAFRRGDLIFVFNFNPYNSYTDYKIASEPGKYKMLISSDDDTFGGLNRVDKEMLYFTSNDGKITTFLDNYLMLYLPVRTAFVFKKYETKKVYG